jgi:hypothetical protein
VSPSCTWCSCASMDEWQGHITRGREVTCRTGQRYIKNSPGLGVVVHICNLVLKKEAEAGGS